VNTLIGKKARYMRWFHLPLAMLGIFNLFGFLNYHVVVWRSLHSQGIGHFYLAIVTVLGSWWLLLAAGLCFTGNGWLRGNEDGPKTKAIFVVLLGALVSFFVPGIMLQAFFIVITWVRSLL
jgi:hypothetical protein